MGLSHDATNKRGKLAKSIGIITLKLGWKYVFYRCNVLSMNLSTIFSI